MVGTQNNAQKIAKHAIASGTDIRDNRIYKSDTIGHGNNVEERGEFVITSSVDRKHVMWPKDFVAVQDGLYRIRVSALPATCVRI